MTEPRDLTDDIAEGYLRALKITGDAQAASLLMIAAQMDAIAIEISGVKVVLADIIAPAINPP